MKFTSPAPESVRLTDPVLAPRQEANSNATIPAALKFCEETHRIDALRLAWKKGDDWIPHVFWDSDVAKVLEGMARDLRIHPDPAAAKRLDEYVRILLPAVDAPRRHQGRNRLENGRDGAQGAVV